MNSPSSQQSSPGVQVVRYVKKGAPSKRRRHRRFAVSLQVEFENLPDRSVDRITNFSFGGVFIETTDPLPLHTSVVLKLTLPNGDRLRTRAQVTHIVTPEQASGRNYAPGLGLRFSYPTPNFRRRLSRFIAQLELPPPRILVVDDDEDFRAALAEGLGALGMSVTFAETGEEALRKLIENLFQIDLVLLDIRMPGLDGHGFLHHVRSLGGEVELPIIVLSAAPRSELELLKGHRGANDVLTKSDPLEEIASRIKSVLNRTSQPLKLSPS